jgi:hypothetical protein
MSPGISLARFSDSVANAAGMVQKHETTNDPTTAFSNLRRTGISWEMLTTELLLDFQLTHEGDDNTIVGATL